MSEHEKKQALIELKGLTKNYEDQQVLKGIDLTIYNKLTVWVEDDIQKYISRKITVDLDFSDN